MAKKSSGEIGKMAGLALLSAAAGALAGVLMAPKSGKETRKAIGRQAKELAKEGERLGQVLVDEAHRQTPTLRKHAKTVHRHVKKLAKQVR